MNHTNEEARRQMQALSGFDPTTLPGQRETPAQEALRLRAENERLTAQLAAATGRLGEAQDEIQSLGLDCRRYHDALRDLAPLAAAARAYGVAKGAAEEATTPGTGAWHTAGWELRKAESELRIEARCYYAAEEPEAEALLAALAPPEKETR